MAHYVDGYVLPVPKKNLQAYRRIAQKAGKIWREHGALEYKECVGDPSERIHRCLCKFRLLPISVSRVRR